jgi:hypothetical protein
VPDLDVIALPHPLVLHSDEELAALGRGVADQIRKMLGS